MTTETRVAEDVKGVVDRGADEESGGGVGILLLILVAALLMSGGGTGLGGCTELAVPA